MAPNNRKQGGRTTTKGTQPPAKKPRSTLGAPAGGAPGGAAPTPPTVNRQMRRSGIDIPDQAEAQAEQKKRLRLILGVAGAIALVLTVSGIALFGISGTWIGVLGALAGVGVGFAVGSGRTFLADKALPATIAIVAVGVLVNVLAATKVLDVHFPLAALLGCGVGAFFAYGSKTQMTAPPDPPAAAQVMLKRNGAQQVEVPGAGNCIWATPDGRMRVVIGAPVPEGTDLDTIATQKDYRKARQAGSLLVRRVAAAGVESAFTIVLDWNAPTTRDGDVTICSVSGLTKVIRRPSA